MAVIIPVITQFNGKGIAKAKKEFAELEGFGAKAGFVLKKSMLPATAAAAGLAAAGFQAAQALYGMAQAAAEDQKEQTQLAQSLKRTTGATSSQIAAVEDYIDKTQRATGVADSKLRPAFGRLVRATKDVDQAQRLLNLSLDIAATTGKPLEAVANALGRAYEGQNTAIGRLGLGIDKATLKGMEFEELQARLEKQFKGGAAAAANTFEGKMARLQIRFDEAKESIGYALLPVLTKMADVAIAVADAFGEGGLGGALKKLQEVAPGLYNFFRTTYNIFAAVGDAAYNITNAVKLMWRALSNPFNIKMPEFGYWMPTWADLLASRAGMGSRGGDANAQIVRGIPGAAGPMGGTGAPTGAGPAGVTGQSFGQRQVAGQQINVTVTSADPRAVVDALVRYNRQNGAVPITVGR